MVCSLPYIQACTVGAIENWSHSNIIKPTEVFEVFPTLVQGILQILFICYRTLGVNRELHT